MKYPAFFSLIVLLAATSCNNKNEQTDSVVHAKVDSIVGTRMEEINRKAMEDLDQRMTIEVKAKADSIIAARRAAAAGDTAARPKQPIP